jgi:hypothetical protein
LCPRQDSTQAVSKQIRSEVGEDALPTSAAGMGLARVFIRLHILAVLMEKAGFS